MAWRQSTWRRRVREYRTESLQEYADKNKMEKVAQRARMAFLEHEERGMLSYPEFLYGQHRYVRKRWWILQGAALLILWIVLRIYGGAPEVQRNMGVMASLFVMLILPELWKNISSHSLEIEAASFYTLRQIYTARLFLFALVDFGMLSLFFLSGIAVRNFRATDFFVDFFIPFVMTCCICFRTLCSRLAVSEHIAALGCVLYAAAWNFVVSDERLYQAVLMPAWGALLTVSLLYLGYCIWRSCAEWERYERCF